MKKREIKNGKLNCSSCGLDKLATRISMTLSERDAFARILAALRWICIYGCLHGDQLNTVLQEIEAAELALGFRQPEQK